MEQVLLAVENLRVDFHTPGGVIRAVNGVSFSVYRDEVLGLVGESGCGKSTLCMGLLRLVPPPGEIRTGRVMFNGADLHAMAREQLRRVLWKEISWVPQGAMSALNPVMRIRDQFYDVIRDHEETRPRKEMEALVEGALARVRLAPEVLQRFPHELSGGMKQRICIAMAMILQPQLIIADEPTSALDVVSQRVVLETLAEARRKLHASMILVGHDMALQAQVADRLAVMYGGNLMEMGSAQHIFKAPQHPYTRRLISSIPSIQHKQDIHAIAASGLTEEEKRVFRASAPLCEVEPGHYVAVHGPGAS